MPLETPTYVEDLVASNPPSGDFRKQGDDHIRNMKLALKQTFARSTPTFTTGGTSTAYTLTTGHSGATLKDGALYGAILHTPCGASATLAVDGTPAKAIVVAQPAGSRATVSGELIASRYVFQYNLSADNYLLVGPLHNYLPSHGGTVTGNVSITGTLAVASTATFGNPSGTGVVLNTDGAIEITRTAGGAYIDFKDVFSEDQDVRIAQAGSGLSISGSTAFSNGITFGSQVVSGADLSKHINLYGGSYGINITSGRLNLVAASTVLLSIDGTNTLSAGVVFLNYPTVTDHWAGKSGGSRYFHFAANNYVAYNEATAEIDLAAVSGIRARFKAEGVNVNGTLFVGNNLAGVSGAKLHTQSSLTAEILMETTSANQQSRLRLKNSVRDWIWYTNETTGALTGYDLSAGAERLRIQTDGHTVAFKNLYANNTTQGFTFDGGVGYNIHWTGDDYSSLNDSTSDLSFITGGTTRLVIQPATLLWNPASHPMFTDGIVRLRAFSDAGLPSASTYSNALVWSTGTSGRLWGTNDGSTWKRIDMSA